MNWKSYKNELLVLLSIMLMIAAFSYKTTKVAAQEQSGESSGISLHELKKIVALKKMWGHKNISKKVDKLKTLVSPSQVKWHKKSKKLNATFSDLDERTLNKVVSTILSLAVAIEKLELSRSDGSYTLEFACKW